MAKHPHPSARAAVRAIASKDESERRIVVAGVDVTERVRGLVDTAPPLTDDRLDRIASLLRR